MWAQSEVGRVGAGAKILAALHSPDFRCLVIHFFFLLLLAPRSTQRRLGPPPRADPRRGARDRAEERFCARIAAAIGDGGVNP